jgi:hypothetical protein
MENFNNEIDLIKKNTAAGLVFKSGTDFYTIKDHSDSKITISFWGIEDEISTELFYKIILNENSTLMERWKEDHPH